MRRSPSTPLPPRPTPEEVTALLPSVEVMSRIDDAFLSETNRAHPLDRTELERKGEFMVENGFNGRGIIPVRDNPKKPDVAYRLFLEKLGDDQNHTQLKAALASVGTAQSTRFLRLLLDQRKKKTPIEILAKQCGIGIPQLREIWRTARLDEGMLALLNAYPRAMKDVARDTRSTREACKFCGGTGKLVDEYAEQKPEKLQLQPRKRGKRDLKDLDLDLPDPAPVLITCPSCSGRGWARKSGDKEARSLMGQILGVSGKPGPLISSTVTNINLESVINEIEQLQTKRPAGIYDARDQKEK